MLINMYQVKCKVMAAHYTKVKAIPCSPISAFHAPKNIQFYCGWQITKTDSPNKPTLLLEVPTMVSFIESYPSNEL